MTKSELNIQISTICEIIKELIEPQYKYKKRIGFKNFDGNADRMIKKITTKAHKEVTKDLDHFLVCLSEIHSCSFVLKIKER